MAAVLESHAGNHGSENENDDGYAQIKGELDHLAACLGALLTQMEARFAQDRRWLRDQKNQVLEQQSKLAQIAPSEPAAAKGLDDPLANIMRCWEIHDSQEAQKPAAPDYVPFKTPESSAQQPPDWLGEEEADAAEWLQTTSTFQKPDSLGPLPPGLEVSNAHDRSEPASLPGLEASNAHDRSEPSSPKAAARDAPKAAAPIVHRLGGEQRGIHGDPGQSTQSSSSKQPASASAKKPAAVAASQPDRGLRSQPSTAEVKRLLDDTWEGSKGERYTLQMPGESNWRCYRYDKDGENKYKLFLDMQAFRVWWSGSFFLDLKEFAQAPNTVCWYSANDTSKSRPCFVWRRIRPLRT